MNTEVKKAQLTEDGQIILAPEVVSCLEITQQEDILLHFSYGQLTISKRPPMRCMVCNTEKGLFLFEDIALCERCTEIIHRHKGGGLFDAFPLE